MQIDVISDTVCPWCFIGKRRLMRAMAMRPNIAFDVKWRPYRLDPTIPKGGMDRQAYMRAKFGDDPMAIVEMHKQIASEGAKDGIEFDFAAIKRRPDTLDSHRLIRWAEAAGVQDEVVERLFIAYFENGEDIGRPGAGRHCRSVRHGRGGSGANAGNRRRCGAGGTRGSDRS